MHAPPALGRQGSSPDGIGPKSRDDQVCHFHVHALHVIVMHAQELDYLGSSHNSSPESGLASSNDFKVAMTALKANDGQVFCAEVKRHKHQ